MELKDQIFHWIKSTLSTRQDYFANLPPCPYAADALMLDRIQIFEFSNKDWKTLVESHIAQFDPSVKKVDVIAISDWKDIDVADLQKWCWSIRDKFSTKDIWLLYDHPGLPEMLGDQSMNFGSHLLFIIQSLGELVDASKDLEHRGYYKKWPEKYFNEVVERRNQYFNKIKNSKTSLS